MLDLGHFCDRAPIGRDGKGSYLAHISGALVRHYVGVGVQLSERRVLSLVCVIFQLHHLGNGGSIGGDSECGNSPIVAIIRIAQDKGIGRRLRPGMITRPMCPVP